MRFGMFIHWGLYAIPARGEWVMSNEKMSVQQYKKYFDEFNPTDFDAKRSIMALSKGSTNEDLTSLDYRHIPRPIFPLDKDFSFEPAENLIRKTK